MLKHLMALLIIMLMVAACTNKNENRTPGWAQPMPTKMPETMLPKATETIAAPPKPTASFEPLPVLLPITLENVDQVKLLRTLQIPGYSQGPVSQCSVEFSPDGRLLVGACGRNPAPVWEVRTGILRHSLYNGSQQIVACAFSPDGKMLACGGFDDKITYWDMKSGEKISDFDAHAAPVWELAFSPDGQQLVSCSLGDGIRLWDVDHNQMIWEYKGDMDYLSVSFNPLGKTVAYGGKWGKAGLLDALHGEILRELVAAKGKSLDEQVALNNALGDVTFSSTGKYIAAGTDGNTIFLWRTTDDQPAVVIKGHQGYVNGVAFSPDETLLVSGSHDRTIGIWSVAEQKNLKVLEGHTNVVLRVAFSPDGTLIASISWDGTVRLWGVLAE